MTATDVQRCTWCVMDDSSDSTIEFDEEGRCNYCRQAVLRPEGQWSQDYKSTELARLLSEMKQSGKGKQYDCIMGLSGGLDSSYLALLGHRWGLRVLAVHIDDGFDSEVSKDNIRRLVAATGFDYLTIRPDADEFAELTKAYMRAGVPNLAVPQDNVLFSFLHKRARQFGIKYFASGGNYALESVLQKGNTHDAYDLVNLRSIWRRFGKGSIKSLALMSAYRRQADRLLGVLTTVRPLDLVDYNREQALQELEDFCGFQYYGSKHLENRLTEFIQLYWFPKKFGVDKRTSHLSSMIVSGQMTREQALAELEKPIYDETEMESCIAVVQEGLGLEPMEFEAIMAAPARKHTDYAVQDDRLEYKAAKALRKVFARSETSDATRGWCRRTLPRRDVRGDSR